MSMNHRFKPSEFRTEEKDGKKYIEGYFIVFDDVYDMGGGWTESVDRHALDGTIHDDVRILLNHDSTQVLGRTSAGTATLAIDDHGVFARCEINELDTDAVNAWARVQRGDVDQASFGFDIIAEEKEIREGGAVHWTLREVKLYELSVCTFPAYQNTSLSARSEREGLEKRKHDEWLENMKERVKKWH